jgi:two-component system sensor histidine kinase KdpD
VAGRQPPNVQVPPKDAAAADWVAAHAQAAGRYASTLSAASWWLLPLAVERGCLGAAGLHFSPPQEHLADEQRQLAEAMVQQIALAADRADLATDLETRSRGERDRAALRE